MSRHLYLTHIYIANNLEEAEGRERRNSINAKSRREMLTQQRNNFRRKSTEMRKSVER